MNISIVIPTYNRCQQLKDLLNSLQKQSVGKEQYEIIVIDDGSMDQTRLFVENFSSSLKIKYAYQKNRGPSAARNRGFALAEGEIVLFADDDMIAPPDWIAKFIRAFSNNPGFAFIQAGCHYCDYQSIFLEATHYYSRIADKVRIVPSDNFSEKLKARYIGTGNLGVHKKRLGKFEMKFDEQLITREDEDLFRRLEKENVEIGFIDNLLIHRPSAGILADTKRFFHYGRGGYWLRQKWGNYFRFNYDDSLKSMRGVFSFKKALIIKIILEMRILALKWGYYWEKNKQRRIIKIRENRRMAQHEAVCHAEERAE